MAGERAIDVFIGVTDTVGAGARLPDVTGPPILAYWNNLTTDGILNNLANYSYDAAGLLPHQAGPLDRMRLMFQGTGAGADDDATMSGDLWAYSIEFPQDPVGQTFQINTRGAYGNGYDLYFYGTSHVITRYNSLDNIFDWIAGTGSLMHFLASGTLSMGYDSSFRMPGLVVYGELLINKVAGDPIATNYENMDKDGAYLEIKAGATLILDNIDMDMVVDTTGAAPPRVYGAPPFLGGAGKLVTLNGAELYTGSADNGGAAFYLPPIESLDFSEATVALSGSKVEGGTQYAVVYGNAFDELSLESQLTETYEVHLVGDTSVAGRLSIVTDTISGIGTGRTEVHPGVGCYYDIEGNLSFSAGGGSTGTLSWNPNKLACTIDTNLDVSATDSDAIVEFNMPAGSHMIIRDDLRFTLPASRLTMDIADSLISLRDGTSVTHTIEVPSSAFILPDISWESDESLIFMPNASAKYIMGSLTRPAGLANKSLDFRLQDIEIRGNWTYGTPASGEWTLLGEEDITITVTGSLELHHLKTLPLSGKIYINVGVDAIITGDGNSLIRDVDASGGVLIECYQCTDGGGNTNVNFN